MAENDKSTPAFQVLERFASGELSSEATIEALTPILAGNGESVDQRLSRAGEQRQQRRQNRSNRR